MSGSYHGKIVAVTDPKYQGRVRVQVFGFRGEGTDGLPAADKTAWCHVCVPFAGPGYGLYCLPELNDEVLVEPTASGDWIVLGYIWSGRNGMPAEGNANTRLFKTPSGHRLQFVEGGDIIIHASGGAEIKVRGNGNIELNGAAGKLVTTEMVCTYTGKKHPQGVGNVKAG